MATSIANTKDDQVERRAGITPPARVGSELQPLSDGMLRQLVHLHAEGPDGRGKDGDSLPAAAKMEEFCIPNVEKIVAALEQVIRY